LGQFREAVFHIEQTLDFFRSHQGNLSLDDTYNFSVNLGLAGVVLAPFGFPDRAVKYAEEGLALMQPHEQHFEFTSALGLLATAYERRGEWRKALQCGELMIEVSQARDLLIARTYGQMHKGACLAMLGKPKEGIVWVRQAIAEREAMNMHFGQFEFLALAGLGHGLVGQVEEGLVIVNEAIRKLENSNDHQSEAAIIRMKGDLLLMQALSEAEFATAQQEAEACFHRAIEIAHSQ
jgi:tetratricopeptide (TPR) repeat protein